MISLIPRSIKWRIQLGLLDDSRQRRDTNYQETSLHDLAVHNISVVESQRKRYEELAHKHYRQSSALSIINDSEMETPSNIAQDAVHIQKMPKKSAKTVVDDPLSVMASMEEEKVKEDKKKELARKKQLLLMSRPHMKHNSSGDGRQKGPPSVENNEQSKTRWDEFYSSKEIMDIINKDLDRLPINHHIYFHQRKTKQVSIDDKDWNLGNSASLQSRRERSKMLSDILFVYAKEHVIGYRQGMHELLSHVLMVIEIDLFEVESSHDSIGNNDIRTVLLNASTIVHDAFSMFDAIMSNLSMAFEHRGENSAELHNQTERMGDATVRIIREWHGDDLLADFITSLDVPPELYCTRWVRLMFSREVSSLENVFLLWDHFLNEFSEAMSLMSVLETTSASMIILIRDQLLPSSQNMYHDESVALNPYNDIGDEQEPMHLLMNYPQIQNISPLVRTCQMLINNQKMGNKPPKVQHNPIKQPLMDDHSSRNQVIYPTQDNFYLHQGPVDFSQQAYPSQPIQQRQQPQQDQFLTTLKSFQTAPALKKLSSRLNAVKGAAKDALQSIDKQLKTQHGVVDNVYHREPAPISTPRLDPGPINQDLFSGYRDLSTIPAIIDEPHHPLPYTDTNIITTEETFVGGSNLKEHQSFGDYVPNVTAPISQKLREDLSEEISRRMAGSIAIIDRTLQNMNSSQSATSEAWAAVSELEALRKEFITKFDVSLKDK